MSMMENRGGDGGDASGDPRGDEYFYSGEDGATPSWYDSQQVYGSVSGSNYVSMGDRSGKS